MENKPILRIVRTKSDNVIEYVAIGTLIAIWAYVFFSYFNLPETIPIHFNLNGEVDGYGNRGILFLLAIVPTVISVGLTVLNNYPHLFNYTVEITRENAEKQYGFATRMIRYLKLCICFLFAAILFEVNMSAINTSNTLGPWFVPIAIALVLFPIVFFTIKSRRTKRI